MVKTHSTTFSSRSHDGRLFERICAALKCGSFVYNASEVIKIDQVGAQCSDGLSARCGFVAFGETRRGIIGSKTRPF